MKPLLLELIGLPRLLSPQGDLLQIGKLPVALLAYLALEKRPVPREHLGGLFWPGLDRSRQFHNLRQAALKIRSIHYEDPLEGNGTLAVKAGFLVTDVEAFYEGVAQGRVAEAVGLWRGPFLQGFRRPESWELEEWADQNRLKLERTLSTSVVTEARRALAAESPSTALSLLEASRKLLPDHLELGTLQAMALAWVGRLPEAEGVLKTLDLAGAPELEGEAAEALAKARTSPLPESPPREVEILEDPASPQVSFPPARRVLPWLLATAALLLFLTFTRSHSSDAASLAGDQAGSMRAVVKDARLLH
jgi:hypothetical protein